MSTFQNLTPNDGQVFVDSYYVSWQWNIEDQLWHRLGNLNGIPVAGENTTGLLSAELKAALDSVSYAGGGFGITVSKPAATVFGDITLRSESFDIQPVDAFGNVLEASSFVASDDTMHAPGFRLSVNEPYLRSFCVEFIAPPGPEGKEGEIGDKGLDGFNDSPKGLFGATGFDANDFVEFSGIKLIDVDDLTTRAVVNLQLDTVDNAFVVTKSELNVADSDVPADQLAPIPITRHLQFILGEGDCKSTLDDWKIVAPTGDPLSDNPDVYLLGVPNSVEIGDVVTPQLTKLSDFINGVTSTFKKKLQACDAEWLKEARDFISSKDFLARTALSNLAQKLADCEFERPLDFSLGIIPGVIQIDQPGSSPEPGPLPQCSAQMVASFTTNRDNPIWDLTPYQNRPYVSPPAYWRLIEVSACVTYARGCVNALGELAGLPSQFVSRYVYDGNMELQIGCPYGTDEIIWPGECSDPYGLPLTTTNLTDHLEISNCTSP